jgi:hypothetical protein
MLKYVSLIFLLKKFNVTIQLLQTNQRIFMQRSISVVIRGGNGFPEKGVVAESVVIGGVMTLNPPHPSSYLSLLASRHIFGEGAKRRVARLITKKKTSELEGRASSSSSA